MNNLAVRGDVGDITNPKPGVWPRDNLHLAVNSNWLKMTEVPVDRSGIRSFGKIDENVEKQLVRDFANLTDGKEVVPDLLNLDKAVALCKVTRNFDKYNSEGAEPIQADLKKLPNPRNFVNFKNKALELDKAGFPLPLLSGVEPDMKNTKINIPKSVGPSTILSDTVTYQTEAKEQLFPIYRRQTANLLEMAGLGSNNAKKYIEKTLEYDEKVAKVVKLSEGWANYPANYNPMGLADFAAKFRGYDIVKYIEGLAGTRLDRAIEVDPGHLDHAERLFSATVFEEARGWMLTCLINNVTSTSPADFRKAVFPFSQALYDLVELSSGEK